MTSFNDECAKRGIFVSLDGVRHEYPSADCWIVADGVLSIRLRSGPYSYRLFAQFGRFDQVGYMEDAA